LALKSEIELKQKIQLLEKDIVFEKEKAEREAASIRTEGEKLKAQV